MSATDPCAVEGPSDPRGSLALIASAQFLLSDYRDVLLKVAEDSFSFRRREPSLR